MKYARLSVLIGFVVLASAFASAKDIYIAQSATGSGSGTSCSAALAASWFNTSGNWGTGASQIGPGTVVHLCGTITSELTVRGNGSSGNPITILFEPGARISRAVCSNRDTNGCINIGNRSYVVIDGGTDGIIENTANGTNLANRSATAGIVASGSSNCEIRNLSIKNMYVHAGTSDVPNTSNGIAAIWIGGSSNNLSIHDNVIHDCHWCINYQFSSNGTGLQIYNNEIYNTDHAIALGGYGGGTLSNTKIYNNHIHDYQKWDNTSNSMHHDGIHAYTNNGAIIDGLDIYNNLFSGDVGANFTSHVYLERDGSNVNNFRVFNNVFLGSPNNRNNFGVVAFGSNTGGQVYNNTIMCGSTSNGYGALFEGGNTIFKNNIVSNCRSAIAYYTASSTVTIDNNVYSNNANVGYFLYNGTNFSSLSAWRSASGEDANSIAPSSAGLDATAHLVSGSPAIAFAQNLSSLSMAALNADKAGSPRPTGSAKWDAGAYNANSVPGPNPPTAVRATAR